MDNFPGISLLWHLRKEGFDLAVNMRTLGSLKRLKARLLLCLVNARVTAAGTLGPGGIPDINIDESEYGDMYERDLIYVVEALGAKVGDKTVEFNVTAEESTKPVNCLPRRI
jgi:hypothetical protein